MLIDLVKIEKKRGMGWVLFLALMLAFSLPAMLMAWSRFIRLRLRNVPQVRLFGKIPFGGALPWSFPLITSGTLLSCAFLMMDSRGSEDFWVLFLIALPQLLTGVLMAVYWAYYRAYKGAIDVVLNRIQNNAGDALCEEPIPFEGFTFRKAAIVKMLDDLADNQVVVLHERADGTPTASIISSELLAHFETNRSLRKPSMPLVTWSCSCCGAPNTTPENGVCEYCGAERSKTADKRRSGI